MTLEGGVINGCQGMHYQATELPNDETPSSVIPVSNNPSYKRAIGPVVRTRMRLSI